MHLFLQYISCSLKNLCLSGITDWLPPTHIPDVLPPVHSSEDWQAAFGFSNSACPSSQHQASSCVTVPLEKYQLPSYHSDSNSKHSENDIDDDSSEQEQSHENKPPLLEHVSPYAIHVSKHGEEVRFNSSSEGYLTQNMERMVMNPPATTNSADNSQQSISHSKFVPDQVIMMPPECHLNNPTSHVGASQHVTSNGFLNMPTGSKFFAEFQLSHQPQHHNHSTVFENANLSSRIPSTAECNTFNLISDKNLSSPYGNGLGKCVINNRNEYHNDIDSIECLLKDKYQSGFPNQHKPIDVNSEFNYRESNTQKFVTTSIGNGELLSNKDDELGFDPFHETQKALAEMMEKENMVSMQNKQSSCYVFHNQQNHINQVSGSKVLNSFSDQSQHIILQQNNGLVNIS